MLTIYNSQRKKQTIMTRTLFTIVLLLVTTQSLTAQEKKFTFYNVKTLVNRDWSCTYTTTKKDYSSQSSQYAYSRKFNRRTNKHKTNYRDPVYPVYKSTSSTILSLKPGDSWDDGKAWILKVTQNGSNKNQTSYEAWKGFYKFYGDGDDEDNLVLRVGFVRKYQGQKKDKQISWKLDSKYKRKGVRFDIPLDEQTIPSNQITLSVIKGFFVNSRGEPAILRYEPYGFLQKLSGQGDIKTVRSTGFIGLGESIEMNDSSAITILTSTGLGNSLPTGCRLHNKK